MEPSTWVVVSGTASPTASTQFHYVIKIVSFPGMVRTGGLWTGDAVLLRLNHPMVLGPNTQPVCVPDTPTINIEKCVVAGWTHTHEGKSHSIRNTHKVTAAICCVAHLLIQFIVHQFMYNEAY